VWGGEELHLLPERAVWWPRERALIIADPHFGKDATFRHAGIPVPVTTTLSDADRLCRLIDDLMPTRLIILGDLMHDRRSRTDETLAALCRFRGPVTLVRGNHDRHAGDPPAESQFTCVDEPLVVEPFALRHHPDEKEERLQLAGHVHPKITIRDGAGPAIRAACFHFGPKIALLPAFGTFTGGHPVKPRRGDGVFMIGEGQVVKLG
jgi:DNA ligase-associated metallophosphoesterase